MFAASEERVAGARLDASFRVPPADHPVFAGHFEGDPLLPGWIQLALAQRLLEEWRPERAVCELSFARFRQPVRPGATLRVSLELDPEGAAVRFTASVDETACTSGQWRLAPRSSEA